MRLTCGSHVVGCVWWHLQLLFAARGLPKTSSEPRRGRGIVFRNSRISLSAGRRACEPAAKPAIPGVILVHNGFVWPGRTRQQPAASSQQGGGRAGKKVLLLSCELLAPTGRVAARFAQPRRIFLLPAERNLRVWRTDLIGLI